MTLEKKQIKFVKRANMWVCSWWENVMGKNKQEQKWFDTEEEAKTFTSSDKEGNSK